MAVIAAMHISVGDDIYIAHDVSMHLSILARVHTMDSSFRLDRIADAAKIVIWQNTIE